MEPKFKIGEKVLVNDKIGTIVCATKKYNGDIYYGVQSKAVTTNANNLPINLKPFTVYNFVEGYPVDWDNDAVKRKEVSAMTVKNMKEGTGWAGGWFIPIFY